MKRTYNFTSETGIKGKATIDWNDGTYRIETDKLPVQEGELGNSIRNYALSYAGDFVAIKYDGKYLTMPNRLLTLDYRSYQVNWQVSYQPGDVEYILAENLEIIQGKEVERPW